MHILRYVRLKWKVYMQIKEEMTEILACHLVMHMIWHESTLQMR